MTARCELKFHNGVEASCDGRDCPFWRAADHLHLSHGAEGCAIQYFGVLGEHGSEIARWLLTVKERLETQEQADTAAAAILERPETPNPAPWSIS